MSVLYDLNDPTFNYTFNPTLEYLKTQYCVCGKFLKNFLTNFL